MVSKQAARGHAAETRALILDKSPYSRYYCSYKGFTAQSVITYYGDGDRFRYNSAAQDKSERQARLLMEVSKRTPLLI
jgi:hypothetical protein